jgi:hypothetical protein
VSCSAPSSTSDNIPSVDAKIHLTTREPESQS